jgi:hypothetical protein
MTLTEIVVAFVGPGLTTAAVIAASVKFLKDRAAKFADGKIELVFKRNELAIQHNHNEQLELFQPGRDKPPRQIYPAG